MRGELIGKEIVVVDSENKANIGIEGSIVNETKHMLVVLDKKENMKQLIKSQVVLLFKKERIKVNGRLLVGRPEDRLKR